MCVCVCTFAALFPIQHKRFVGYDYDMVSARGDVARDYRLAKGNFYRSKVRLLTAWGRVYYDDYSTVGCRRTARLEFPDFLGTYQARKLKIRTAWIILRKYISIPIKEQCVFVCWFVCLLFIGHTTFVHFAALPPSPRAGAVAAGGPARAGKHAQREHARACRTTSQRKNCCADAFQKQNRMRAHAVVYVTGEIFKKKREKENQHATSQVQFTVFLLLECLLFESY